MTDAPLGQVLPGDPPALRFVRELAHPIDKVWSAITEREHLRSWMPCDIVGERREGASLRLPFWPEVLDKHGFDDPGLTGTVRVWDPPRTFEWSWDTDVVRFELAGDDRLTVLTLTTWLSGKDAGPAQTAAGYHVCLDHLAQVLETGSAASVVTTDPGPLERRYHDIVEDSLA
jgi:uncharacterized protein YndB with AHSA1/START domain